MPFYCTHATVLGLSAALLASVSFIAAKGLLKK